MPPPPCPFLLEKVLPVSLPLRLCPPLGAQCSRTSWLERKDQGRTAILFPLPHRVAALYCMPSVRPRRPSPSRLSPTRRRDGGISLTTFGNWYSASIRRDRTGDKITSRVDQEPGGSPTPQKAPSPFVSLLCWPFGLAALAPPFPSPPETRNCAAARS